MSILCSHKRIEGADLIRLIARAQDREDKLARHPQEVEREGEPVQSKWWQLIAKGLFGGVALMIIIHLLVWVARADDSTFLTAEDLAISLQPQFMLEFKIDGTASINGKEIESLSHPEIKEELAKLVRALEEQNNQASMVRIYDRQTGYLLEKLEQCLRRGK